MYTGDKYLFTTSQTYTSSGATIAISSLDIDGNTDTSLANNQITLTSGGQYLISWNINWQSLYANRSTFGASCTHSGTTIAGSTNLQYFRYNTYGHKSTTGCTFLYDATAGDRIQWETFLHAGSVNHKVTSTDGDPGAISIIRLS